MVIICKPVKMNIITVWKRAIYMCKLDTLSGKPFLLLKGIALPLKKLQYEVVQWIFFCPWKLNTVISEVTSADVLYATKESDNLFGIQAG